MNNDGKADLVSDNQDGSLSILLGKGDGTFQPAYNFDGAMSGSSLVGFALGDFNGDGIADIAAIAPSQTGVTIYMGAGGGTFRAPVLYATGGTSGGSPVTVADFNGDGKLDIAVTEGSSIGVLLGNGDGTFRTAVTYSAGTGVSAQAITTGDFNGDGVIDLAAINDAASGTVSILPGNGDGSFQSATQYAVGNYPFDGITVGDFNGDGVADIAVANFNSNNVSVLLGIPASKATTTTTLTPQANPNTYGNLNYFTVSVSPSSATGTVTLLDGTNTISTTSVSGGPGLFIVFTLAPGTHSLTAVYAGDSTHAASTSTVLSEVINTGTPTVTLGTSANPSLTGQAVTLFASVVPSAATRDLVHATGTVTFMDGSTVLGSGSISNSVVSLSVSTLAAGTTLSYSRVRRRYQRCLGHLFGSHADGCAALDGDDHDLWFPL